MSLAFGFVKQSGGQIDLASEAGSETTVSMYFPLLQAAGGEVAPATLPPALRTVLLVEDEAPGRQASSEVLRKLGLCVLEAADGETALGMIRQGLPIDLVFTDLVMPGQVRGQDLAAATAHYLPQAKLLFASGYPGEGGADDDLLGHTTAAQALPARRDGATGAAIAGRRLKRESTHGHALRFSLSERKKPHQNHLVGFFI
ncbi:response regulator [Massilia sp.]|uniref:response regulator n=1 Tax=Massilia sp. TaxID=1882437 RepID=UPI00391BC21A